MGRCGGWHTIVVYWSVIDDYDYHCYTDKFDILLSVSQYILRRRFDLVLYISLKTMASKLWRIVLRPLIAVLLT
jgi:hypothetical protein